MTIIQLGIPDDIQGSFEPVFPGEEPAAILPRLLEAEVAQREGATFDVADAIIALRAKVPPVSPSEVAAARDELRQ